MRAISPRPLNFATADMMAQLAHAPRGSATIPGGVEARRVSLMGVTLHACAGRQLLDRMFAALDWGLGGWVVTANLDILRQIVRDPEVRELAGEASLVVADGMPLVWASRLARTRPLERVAGSSLIDPLCEMSVPARRSVFFLGGSPGTADAAARVMAARHPGLPIAGTYCPPYGFEGDDRELAAGRAQLHPAPPAIGPPRLRCPMPERPTPLTRGGLP